MNFPLNTPFKGARHYIQGGDLFNAAEAVAAQVTGANGAYISKLMFTKFAYNLCYLVPVSEAGVADGNTMGEGEFALPDGRDLQFFLCQGAESPRSRVPYDEEGMVSTATYTARAATLQAPIAYSSIEAVIALTKALNYRLSAPKIGKWVFGKLALNQAMPVIQTGLTITCTKAVPGRFSVNEINIDGVTIGNIHFIVGAP